MKLSPLTVLILLLLIGAIIFAVITALRNSEDEEADRDRELENTIMDIPEECENSCVNKIPSVDYRSRCPAGETDNCFFNSVACNNGVTAIQPTMLPTYHAQIVKVRDGYLITGDSVGNGCLTNSTTGVEEGPYCAGGAGLPDATYALATPFADGTAIIDNFANGDGQAIRQVSYAKIGGTSDPSDPYYPRYPLPSGVYPVLGAIGASSEAVFIMNDGTFWTIGDPNSLIEDSVNNTVRYMPWRARPEVTLPPGVEPCNLVKMLGAGTRSAGHTGLILPAFNAPDGITLILNDVGDLYGTGPGIDFLGVVGQDTQNFSVPLNTTFRVADFDVSTRHAIVVDTDQNIHVAGWGVYDGVNAITAQSFPGTPWTQVAAPPLPAGVTITKVQVSVDGSGRTTAGVVRGVGDYQPTYTILASDGTVWSLGSNHFGFLGINQDHATLNESLVWVQVLYTDGSPLENVIELTTSGFMNRYSNAIVIVDDPDNGINRQVRVWGFNSASTTSASLGVLGLDHTVYLDVIGVMTPDYINVGDSDDGALHIGAGGHITPYIKPNGLVCNCGHNVTSAIGAFGDGTEGSRGQYICVYNATLGQQDICFGCDNVEGTVPSPFFGV